MSFGRFFEQTSRKHSQIDSYEPGLNYHRALLHTFNFNPSTIPGPEIMWALTISAQSNIWKIPLQLQHKIQGPPWELLKSKRKWK